MNTRSYVKPNLEQKTVSAAKSLESLLSDILEPSIRPSEGLKEATVQHKSNRGVTGSALSELAVPRGSHRVGFNEFLD
jgi:hypothetical protein